MAVELTPAPYSHHIETYLPLEFGSAARTPDYAHEAWGIVTPDEPTVVRLYQEEWETLGNERKLQSVSQASLEAGFDNYPELLRQKTAEVAGALVRDYDPGGAFRLLDIGCGPGLSTLAVYQALPSHLQKMAEIVLVEPSETSLLIAATALEKHGAKSIVLVKGVDLDLDAYIEDGSVDLITATASIHHHAKIPFEKYKNAQKQGGFTVIGDWHNSVWEHPYRAYELLRRFPPTPYREVMLQKWLEWYPNAQKQIPEPENPADRKANQDIMNLWLAYERLLREHEEFGRNAIWPLEGHRSVERYVNDMRAVGFETDSPEISQLVDEGIMTANPYLLLPDSRLLMVTVGQKLAA